MSRSESGRRHDSGGFTLLELMIVCSLLMVVLGVVSGILIASNKAVATAAVRLGDTQDARTAVQRMEASVQFATSLSVSNGASLYAGQANGTCDVWTISGNDLDLKVGTQTGVVVSDVSAPKTGNVFERNTSYPGLVSVRFSVTPTGSTVSSDSGMSVNDTFASEDLPTGGGVTTNNSC